MFPIPSDLRFALRTLRAKPVFSLIAVLSLALGIGANTAIFSVIESALLRGLPFGDAERLVQLRDRQPCCEQASVSPGEYLDYKNGNKTLSGLAALAQQRLTLTGQAEPESLQALVVTTNYFEVLGAKPELGRLMSSQNDRVGNERVAVLSDALWRSKFGSDRGVVGRDITLSGNVFRVIGVLEAKQSFPAGSELWISPRLAVPEYNEGQMPKGANIADQYGDHWLSGLGRLRPGTTISQTRAELETIAAGIARTHPGEKDHHPALFALQDTLVRDVRPVLWILAGAVVLLLLIACANLAGLLLARATGRTRELAVRVSLGASRWQVIRLLLSESLLLALAGGILGLAVAEGLLRVISRYSPYNLPPGLAPELNAPVLAFCLAITLLTALACGLLPALRSARVNVSGNLKAGSKGSATGGARRLRRILVSAEIALSIVLLSGASLLMHSFAKLLAIDPGFHFERVFSTRLSLPETRYATDAARAAFWQKLLEQVNANPGVSAAGLMTDLPFDGSDSGSYMESEEHPGGPNSLGLYANEFGASPQTFRSLRVPLLAGRVFDERDKPTGTIPVVINQALADKLFPHENPLGKRLLGGPVSGAATVIGVVANFRHDSLNAPPAPDMFFNYTNYGNSGTSLIILAKGQAGSLGTSLRSTLRQLDSDLPFRGLKPLESYLAGSLAARRFLLGLLSAFSGLAILLAGMGLYGALAYSVQQRRQEIGIRMALGAQTGDVLGMVLFECAAIAAVGMLVGLTGSFWSSSYLASMLVGIKTDDLLAYGAAVAIVIAIAAGASALPALRAASIDPVSALRYE